MNLQFCFVAGIVAGELFQWGTWKGGHPDQPWAGYWKVGLPHLLVNIAVVVGVVAFWYSGALTKLLEVAGFSPIAQLLSISPPWGFVVAMLSDICGDKIAYILRDPVGLLLTKFGLMKPKEAQ